MQDVEQEDLDDSSSLSSSSSSSSSLLSSSSLSGSGGSGHLSDLQLQALEQRLVDAPFDYALHEQRVVELRLRHDWQALRAARQQMSALFPLPASAWTAWLDDETERGVQLELLQRAVGDYAVPQLWMRWLELLARDTADVAGVRDAADRALAACGANVAEGAALWAAVQRIEFQLAARLGDDESVARIRRLALERAALPLVDDDDVHREYLEWEAARAAADDGEAIAAIERAQELVVGAQATRDDLLAAHEAAVANTALSDFSRWPAWQAYIVAEQTTHAAPPRRVIALFERALVPFCLFADLWQLYVAYLVSQQEYTALGVAVCERAVRNLPWTASLWVALVEAHGRAGATPEALMAVVQRAVAAGLQSTADYGDVYVAALMALRARATRHFAVEYDDAVSATPPQARDAPSSVRVPAAIADNAAFDGVVAQVRTCYEQAVAAFKSESGFALELRGVLDWALRFELDVVATAPDVDARRNEAYNRARLLFGELLRVNPRHLDSWLRAADFEVRLGARARARAMYGSAVGSVSAEFAPLVAAAWLAFERVHGDSSSVALVRQATAAVAQQAKAATGGADKRKRRDADAPKKPKRARSEVDEAKAAAAAAAKQEKLAAKKAAADAAAKAEAAEAAAAAKRRELVIRSLPFSMSVAQARTLLEDFGAIDAMRLLTSPDGRSKGIVFCTFVTPDAAAKAKRELTGKKLEGRVLQVQWAKDDANPIGADHDETLTAYVSQLHVDVTEQELRDFFAAAAPPTGVRRAVGKKFAFVEFADADAVRRAVALTGTTLRDQAIRVQRSDPSLAEKHTKPPPAEATPHIPTRKPALLLPRSMAVSKSAATAPAEATSKPAEADAKPKSNADFRKLLG
jgi:RNA recognition motif-containing protein